MLAGENDDFSTHLTQYFLLFFYISSLDHQMVGFITSGWSRYYQKRDAAQWNRFLSSELCFLEFDVRTAQI